MVSPFQLVSEISYVTSVLRPSAYPLYLSVSQCQQTSLENYQLLLSAFIPLSKIIKQILSPHAFEQLTVSLLQQLQISYLYTYLACFPSHSDTE